MKKFHGGDGFSWNELEFKFGKGAGKVYGRGTVTARFMGGE